MGRGRVKGRKLSATDPDEPFSGDEEKVPVQKKRGRPTKTLKNKIEEEDEARNFEDEVSEHNSDNEDKTSTATQDGKRSKLNAEVEGKADTMKGENGTGIRLCMDGSNKLKSLRPNGNRRKNKPRRAAEACVECI